MTTDPASLEDEEDDLTVEMALLAMSEDMSGPTEDVDLSTLSPMEKRALLRYLRAHLGVGPGENEPLAGEA